MKLALFISKKQVINGESDYAFRIIPTSKSDFFGKFEEYIFLKEIDVDDNLIKEKSCKHFSSESESFFINLNLTL